MIDASQSKRRVLVLVTSLDRGGAQRHVRDLLAGRLDGCEFHLAGGSEGWLAREAVRLGVAVHPLYVPRGVYPVDDLRAYRPIRALLERLKPDLLHVHSTKAAFLGRLAARGSGIPVVYSVHGWPFQAGFRTSGAVLSFLAEYLLRDAAERVIVVSQRDAVVARRFRLVPSERMVLIENGIDVSAYPWHPGPYGRRLIYTGRLEHGKGLGSLLHALADLRQYHWDLTICGEGSLYTSLETATRQLGIAGRVRFVGWTEDLLPALASTDCILLPSDKEGTSYSVLEALACGLSAIVTSVGTLADLDLRQVIHIPPRNDEALHGALREFLAEGWCDPARLPRRGEVASLFAARFNLSRMTEQVAMVYRSILDPAGSGSDRLSLSPSFERQSVK